MPKLVIPRNHHPAHEVFTDFAKGLRLMAVATKGRVLSVTVEPDVLVDLKAYCDVREIEECSVDRFSIDGIEIRLQQQPMRGNDDTT